MIKICLLFFGPLRGIVPGDEMEVEAREGATVAEIVAQVGERPECSLLRKFPLAFAVRDTFVDRDFVPQDCDRLALLPPVSGG